MNEFNRIKFNNKERIKYAGSTLEGNSKIIADLGMVSINLQSKSKLLPIAEKEKIITIHKHQGLFGGSFNNLKFNRGDRIQYSKLGFSGKSDFNIFEGNVSVTFNSKSNVTANNIRVRYPNIEYSQPPLFNRVAFNHNAEIKKGMFRSTSMISFNPHFEVTAGIVLDSKSEFKINAHKYMWTNTDLISKSNFTLIPIRVRFQGVSFKGKSKFECNAVLVSQETLQLLGLGFKPNDVIVIDLDNYYITHNGVDITYKAYGVFFKFYPDKNILYWKDDVNSRNVKKDILYQNKYL